MAKFGEVTWKVGKAVKSGTQENPEVHRESFWHYCRLKFEDSNILEYSKIFQAEYKRLEEELAASKAIFEKIPLIAAFVEWVQEAHSKNFEEIEDARLLLGSGLIGLKDSEGATWTLHHASLHNPNQIYGAIRCRREWSLSQRERLVLVYMRFISYLSSRTDGYINQGADSERNIVSDRDIRLELFARFADQLNDKLQLVAKLLYFGGNRTLEEVLKLTISEVYFEEELISFGTEAVSYPLHVFADIKAIIGKRSTGNIFLGRQNALLNSTTVFRNFKEAGLKAGMGTHFTPSYLTAKRYALDFE